MTAMEIRFYEDFVDSIWNEEKTQTLRYGWSKLPEKGDSYHAISTQKGDAFAEIEIQAVEELTVEESVQRDFSGHRNYTSVEELLEELEEYYDGISEETTLHLIEFELTEKRR